MNRRRFHPRVYGEIRKRQRNRCATCGEPLKDGKCQFDHEAPLWTGGTDSEENLRALCDDCHTAKTSREAKQRAKEARIRAQAGLLKPKLNRKAKVLAKMGARA